MSAKVARLLDANEPSDETWPSEVLAGLPLRAQAQIHYCFLDQSISLAGMAAQPPFDSVQLRTLEHWSSEDQWAERRRQAQEDLEARVQKAVGDRIVQKRIELLDQLEQIESQVLDECMSSTLKFRSKEGAISALVRLARLADDLREKVQGGLTARRDGTPEKVPTPMLTAEEARAAAKAILGVRRKQCELDGQLESAPA